MHTAWTTIPEEPPIEIEAIRHESLVPKERVPWFKDIEASANMIASGADGNAMLTLMGGETFLIDSTWRLLNALVERGVARHLLVGLATNGQHRNTMLETLATNVPRLERDAQR